MVTNEVLKEALSAQLGNEVFMDRLLELMVTFPDHTEWQNLLQICREEHYDPFYRQKQDDNYPNPLTFNTYEELVEAVKKTIVAEFSTKKFRVKQLSKWYDLRSSVALNMLHSALITLANNHFLTVSDDYKVFERTPSLYSTVL